MMRLLCNGVVLDLYDNASLQFTHENPLFAFDKLACERTTQFKLPCTPTNDSVLEVARIPAYPGAGMRQRFTAQLQADSYVKDGYLYISEFDGKDYTAIFVTGELVGLQKLKELGTIKELEKGLQDSIKLAASGVSPSAGANQIWYNINYKHDSKVTFMPSISLKKLWMSLDSSIHILTGVNLPSLPPEAQGVRIIPPKPIGADAQCYFTVIINDPSQPTSPAPSTIFNLCGHTPSLFTVENTQYGVTVNNRGSSQANMYYRVQQFKAWTKLTIAFPDDFPDTIYLFDLSLAHDDSTSGHFYGDRYFSAASWQAQTNITRYGEPWAGRSIELNAGDCFSFVDERYYNYWRTQIGSDYYYNAGFFLGDSPTMAIDYSLRVTTNPSAVGDVVRLVDHLPDISVIELLKTVAALSGRILYYDDENGISFEKLYAPAWYLREVGKLTQRGNVKRTFADYGQNNLVQFDDDNAKKIVTDYTIQNENLAETKDLQVLPFSEGGADGDWVFVKAETEKFILGKDDGTAYLARVALPKNAYLQNICTESTQYQIQARMSLLEYNLISPKNVLRIENIPYLWTSRSWQDNVAKMTLAKISSWANWYGLTEATRSEIVSAYGEYVWETLVEYVAANPAFVPFLNNDPHLACSLIDTGYRRYIHGGVSNQVSTGIVPTTTMVINSLFRMNSVTAYHAVFQQGYISEAAQTTRACAYNGNADSLFFTHCGRASGGYNATVSIPNVAGKWVQMQLTDTYVQANGSKVSLTGTNRGTSNTNPIWLLGRGNTYGATNIDISYFETIDGAVRNKFVPYKVGSTCYILNIVTLATISGSFTIAEESI